MNPFSEFLLRAANVPDQDITDLEKAQPELARLFKAAKQLEPAIRKATPLIEQLWPVLVEGAPIVKAAYPDFVAALGTMQEWLAFATSRDG
jgi:hypothetical protein